jgi:hypothetical protein
MNNDTLPAVIETTPPAVNGSTANVLALISRGMETGATPESMGQLVSLYERVMAKDAEAKFLEAKRAFQSECPVIGKNRLVDVKTKEGKQGAKYRFADLEKIVQTIRPLLDRHGFSYDFAQEYQGSIVTVTCFLRHSAGHVEATKFSGPWETTASMSAIQKSASATTFCQRYALRMALGLPVGEDDDAPPEPHENPEQHPDAPKVKPRGQRNEPDTEISAEQRLSIFRAWKEVYGDEVADKSKNGFGAAFDVWCRHVTGESWNPITLGEWTQARFDKLNAKLPGGEA